MMLVIHLFAGPSSDSAAPSLLERNPFGGVRKMEVSEPKPFRNEIESLDQVAVFHGSYQMGENRVFSLRFLNVEQKKWMSINDTLYGLTIVGFDPDQLSLLVEYNGERGLLKLLSHDAGNRANSNQLVNRSVVSQPGKPMPVPSTQPPAVNIRPPMVTPKRIPKPEEMQSAIPVWKTKEILISSPNT